MLRLVADEDFNNRIVRGVLRRNPRVDIVCVNDVPSLGGSDDPVVLEWAAREGRLVLTHDQNTMTKHARERIVAGQSMPGLIVVPQTLSIGQAIEETLLLDECSEEGEWDGQILFLPFR